MYIKASNTKNVVDMKDYALIELLPVYLNDGYYTKEVVDKFINEIVMGEVDLKGYIDEKELTMALNGFIKEIKIQYRQTDDSINDPADNDDLWADDIPEWINEKFVWQRLVIDYGNGEKYYSDPVCISGAKGDTGEKGRSLIGITPQWCLNNDGNWNNFIPELTEYDTIWIRHELQWDYPAETNYTPEVQDFVYEKVKELFNRMVAEEENTTKVQEELESIKENITEIEENYATKDELENVINSNRINMFRNGDFYDGQTSWSVYGSGNNIPRLQENKTYPHGKAIVIQGEPTHIQHLSQVIHPIANIIGQEYTISCMVNCDNADDGFDMPLYGLKVEVYYGKEVVDEIFAEVENFDNEWCKLSTTFTVEQDYDYFECSFYVRDTSKTIRVVGFMFEEGNLANPFQINVREMQNKIPTRLGQLENDKDYVTFNDLEIEIEKLKEEINDLKTIIADLSNNE